MADNSAAESTAANQPVSLPPRGFEMDQLQASLESAQSKLGDDPHPTDVDAAMKQAVSDALPEGQPSLENDPATIDGFERVVVQDDDGALRTTHVYVAPELTPAKVAAIADAKPDGDRVMTGKGKTVAAEKALAENITGGDA